MEFITSKKYDGIQLYHKKNNDISYYIRYKDENNKLKRIKIGDKSKGITEPYCNQKRIEILNSIRLGEDPPSIARKKKKKAIILNDIADIYFKQREVHSKNNIKSSQKYSNKLKVHFGNEDIDNITADKILEYQLILKNIGLAPATINYTITFLGTLFNIAIEENLYKNKNPLNNKKIRRLKVDNHRERYFTTEEIKEIYNHIKDKDIKLFVDLALSTGGRLETILNIQKKDINLKDCNITLKDFKNNSTYKGFIPTSLTSYLKENLKNLSTNDFAVGGTNIKFSTRIVQRRLKDILDKLYNQGLDTKDRKNRVVLHTLRHTFASHLAINGTPIFTIQKLMNHRDINMTLRYAKLAPDSGRNFVNELYK